MCIVKYVKLYKREYIFLASDVLTYLFGMSGNRDVGQVGQPECRASRATGMVVYIQAKRSLIKVLLLPAVK